MISRKRWAVGLAGSEAQGGAEAFVFDSVVVRLVEAAVEVVEFHAVELAEPEALAQHDVLLFGDHCRLFAKCRQKSQNRRVVS